MKTLWKTNFTACAVTSSLFSLFFFSFFFSFFWGWSVRSNSKHWFTTSFVGGRCRKAMLGVWVKVTQNPNHLVVTWLQTGDALYPLQCATCATASAPLLSWFYCQGRLFTPPSVFLSHLPTVMLCGRALPTVSSWVVALLVRPRIKKATPVTRGSSDRGQVSQVILIEEKACSQNWTENVRFALRGTFGGHCQTGTDLELWHWVRASTHMRLPPLPPPPHPASPPLSSPRPLLPSCDKGRRHLSLFVYSICGRNPRSRLTNALELGPYVWRRILL